VAFLFCKVTDASKHTSSVFYDLASQIPVCASEKLYW